MDRLRNKKKTKKIKLLNDKDTIDQAKTKLLQTKTKNNKLIKVNENKFGNTSKDYVDDLLNRIKDLEILNAINLEIHKFHDLEQVFETALDMTESLENVDGAKIYLVDEQRNEAVLMGYRNLSDDYLKNASRIPYPKGVTWKAIISGAIINIEDAVNYPNTGPAGRRLGHHGLLGVPIKLNNKTIGVLWFDSYKERKFDKQEVELLSSIGYQIATAIAKANLYKELMIKNRYETIISSVVRSVHQSIDLQDVMENAIDALRENISGIQHLGIYLVEGDEAVLKSHRGLPRWFYQKIKRIPYPKGFIWNTILEGKSRYVADADKDNIIGAAGKKFGTKSYLCVPIRNDGNPVGVLGIASLEKNGFDQDELKLLEIVAHQIEIAINNATQAEALKQSEEALKLNIEKLSVKSRYENIINAIISSIHQSINLDQVLDKVVESLINNYKTLNIAAIYMIEGKEAVLKSHVGYPKKYVKRASRISYGRGATWKAAIDGKTRYVPDGEKDKYLGPAGRELGTQSYLCVPLYFYGKVVGVLNMISFQKNAFNKEERMVLETVGKEIEIAINNAQQAEALRISEERYKILFDQSPVGVYISDNELRITQCNQRMVEIINSTQDKIIGLEMKKLKDQSFVASMEKAIKGESIYHESYYEATTSSAKLWLALHYSPLLDAEGTVIGGIGIVQDVTERKQAEIESEDKKRRLLSTFNSFGNIVIATDMNGKITFINRYAEKCFGWVSEYTIGLELAKILKIRNSETNKLLKIPKGKMLKEDAFVNKFNHYILILNNGNEIPIDIDTSYIRENTGEICGIVLVISELSSELDLSKNKFKHSQRSKFTMSNLQNSPINLMIYTSSVYVEEGISNILDGESGINIVARTTDNTEINSYIEKYKPDILLFDTAQVKPEIQEILTFIKEIETKTKVLLLLQGWDEKFIINPTSLGVRGCLTQDSSKDQLVQAILTVHNNEIWMDVRTVTKILTRLVSKQSSDLKPTSSNLTNKEKEIVKLVAEGLSNNGISQKLYINEITVKTHLRNIFKKIGVNSRIQLFNKYRSETLYN